MFSESDRRGIVFVDIHSHRFERYRSKEAGRKQVNDFAGVESK